MESDYNYAKTRVEELLAEYEEMTTQKQARDEEQAFQNQIDAQNDKIEELWETIDT